MLKKLNKYICQFWHYLTAYEVCKVTKGHLLLIKRLFKDKMFVFFSRRLHTLEIRGFPIVVYQMTNAVLFSGLILPSHIRIKETKMEII